MTTFWNNLLSSVDNTLFKTEGYMWWKHSERMLYTTMNACSVIQSCPTLCDPMGCSPPGSSVCGIYQSRVLECVLFPSPRDLPSPGIKPASLAPPVLAGGFFTTHTHPEGPQNPCECMGGMSLFLCFPPFYLSLHKFYFQLCFSDCLLPRWW